MSHQPNPDSIPLATTVNVIPTPELEIARDEAERRFFTARDNRKPADVAGLDSSARVALLKEATVTLGTLILAYVPDGRNRALALTALEDVQMRANRGIFAS